MLANIYVQPLLQFDVVSHSSFFLCLVACSSSNTCVFLGMLILNGGQSVLYIATYNLNIIENLLHKKNNVISLLFCKVVTNYGVPKIMFWEVC